MVKITERVRSSQQSEYQIEHHTREREIRFSDVGQTFIIFDWAFQTDPGNPELLVRSGDIHR